MKRSSKERITSAKHSLISTSVFAVLVLMGSASKLESATITWTGLQKTSNTGKATDLYKQFIVGKVVDAAYVGVFGHKADPVPPVIINDTVNSRKISFRVLDKFGPGNLTGGPFDTGDTSFNGMMKTGNQHPGNLVQLTMIGLTSGTDYTVQFWSISENMQLGGNARTTGEACCGVSWYDVGTFTADAPTQVITLGTKGRTAWNAFLVTVATHPEPKEAKAKPAKPVQAKANKPAVPKAKNPVAAPTQPQVIIPGGPKRGVFPEEGAGIHVHGDLVISDPVNRRGALREKRHSPRHYFAMLPYGMVWYHGAPADIRDLPPGIHMHGRFLLPMEGEEATIPLTEKLLKNHENHRYNHAILLEDDVSFYSRRGRSWKVLGFEQGGGPAPRLKLSVEPVGPEIEGGINKAALFDIDDSTRVWKDRQLVNKDQIKEGMDVQVNLTWGPFDSLATMDVWLDETSLKANREIQRQRHLRMIRSRFLPGWVDEVKNNDTGGGEVTVTFFGGMDQELYDDIRKSQSLKICNAETTLRSWNYHQEHASPATVLEKKEIKDPPLGSSGLQVRLKVTQMLDGFRPGWVVRVKGPWIYVLLPWDEHIKDAEAYEKSRKMILP